MIDLNFFFSYARPTTLSDLTDRDFRAEFRRPALLAPPPSIFQSPFGAVGQERQAAPTPAPRSTPEPYGLASGFHVVGEHHHHIHRQLQQQQPQQRNAVTPPLPNGRLAEQDRRHPNRNAVGPPHHRQGRAPHEPRVERPACCCFCYGTAKAEAAAAGRPVPPKDGPGYWSGHHSITGGRVVCPVLFEVVCGVCGDTGAEAHTTEYHLQHPELFRRH
ncbi:hypothetical protein CAEBREN_11725 [Caenorhabditis brenneri]|uniref:Nanos-type domain-containing protein n=1 Tax=Caenorhabditis brenneri TaxID=135651 RepID=G0MQ23_CAEBE|nr:hypothetical protein CAEBREN_11725 [Caenorhabditis brenneri]